MAISVASHTESDSFTDILQENMSRRDTNSRILPLETATLLVKPEDPELSRQLMEEDMEWSPLRHEKRRRTMEAGAQSRCWWPSCSKASVCGSISLMMGVALGILAGYTCFDLPKSSAGSLPIQVASIFGKQKFFRTHRDAATQGAKASDTRRRPRPIMDIFSRSGRICNVTAPVPITDLRRWNVPDDWRRACEKKNAQDRYPYERNWCWVGLKNMCHWNLKEHKSWAEYQEMAAASGMTVPRDMLPFSPLADPEVCDVPEHGQGREWTDQERVESRAWFKEHVAVYVLTLQSMGDSRWSVIHQRLNDLGIWHTRVYGVDMRQPGAMDAAKRFGFMPQGFNFTRAQDIAYTDRHNMGSVLGTAGCASAHFKVHAKIIADAAPLALVLEDDSWLTEDFVPRVWSLVREELPCDWQVTALLSRCGYGRCISRHLMRVMPDGNEPAWRCRQGSNWGMHAVLYRTSTLPKLRKRWQSIVFDEERPHCMDVDVALASISDQVGFYAVPAVQDPGFVREMDGRSARWDINQAAQSTTTMTTTTLPLPQPAPGEPWPGAWNR